MKTQMDKLMKIIENRFQFLDKHNVRIQILALKDLNEQAKGIFEALLKEDR